MKRIKRITTLLLAVSAVIICMASCQTDGGELTDEEQKNFERTDDTSEVIEPKTDTTAEIQETIQDTEAEVSEPAFTVITETTTTPKPEVEIYSIDEFNNGLAVISTNKGYGYINTRGKIVIEPLYENAGKFLTELARIEINGKYGY